MGAARQGRNEKQRAQDGKNRPTQESPNVQQTRSAPSHQLFLSDEALECPLSLDRKSIAGVCSKYYLIVKVKPPARSQRGDGRATSWYAP
jgi:hypothetical protein